MKVQMTLLKNEYMTFFRFLRIYYYYYFKFVLSFIEKRKTTNEIKIKERQTAEENMQLQKTLLKNQYVIFFRFVRKYFLQNHTV